MDENTLFSNDSLGGFVLHPSFGYFSMQDNPGFSLVAGETYTVIWDDTENPFTVTAYEMSIPEVGDFVAIGNGELVGYPSNGEPFLIAVDADNVFFLAGTDDAGSHAVRILRGVEDTAPDVVLRDRNGKLVVYQDIKRVRLSTVDGTMREYVDAETIDIPEIVEDMPITLDFSEGDQSVVAPDGYAVKSATIQKPADLVPENILADKEIAGVVGTLEVPEILEDVPIELDFTNGDQEVVVPEGYAVQSAVIQQPETLVSGNIAEGVDIAGIVGTLMIPEILEDVEIQPDFTNGDQIIVVPEGYVVRSAVIQKPENLSPENIAEGVEIAGITGTFASGGGLPSDACIVSFMSHDGAKVLHERAVLSGNDCMEVVSGGVIDAPTKESSNTEVYTFAGWSLSKNGTVDANALKNVTADRYVYAVYTASTRYYSISYYDGDTLLKTEQLMYGAMPDYEPEKTGYALTGWEPALTKVVGDAVYYAQWQEAEVILYSGTCGENATWIINAVGTLRISGTGATYDYVESASQGTMCPWYSLGVARTITSIEIGEGITELGEYLFPWTGVTDGIPVTLPESLKTIAYRAFYYCDVTSITIPRNVTSIEDRAFERCSKLTDMTVLCAATWGNSVLENTSNALTNLYIENWETWLQNSFSDSYASPMDYLDNFYVGGVLYEGGDFVIPDGLTTIGAYVCYNLGIKNLTVPASVRQVGAGAFEYSGYTSSEQLQSLHYEGDLAGWCELAVSGPTSFDMASTTKLYIGGNLVTGDLVIPDGVLAINAGAFAYQTGITSVTLPDSLKIVGNYAFRGCSKINTVTYKGTLAEWCEVQHGVVSDDYLRMAPNVYVGGSLLSGNIVIPDGVTEVPAGFLYNKTGVTGISIPAGVTKIGSYACYGCTSLTSLSLPDSLTWIADHAFQNCSGIKSVTIPAAVEKISGYAFAESGLTSVTFEDTSGTWYAGKYSHSTTVGSYNTKLSGVPTLTYFTGSTYKSYYLTRAS